MMPAEKRAILQMTKQTAIVAECCFADVGQGTCNIILLGDGRAVVIDCGPRRSFAVIKLLKHLGVTQIEALIVSHNDEDHCGGAEAILGDYRDSILQIYFLSDRTAPRNRFLDRIIQEEEAGNLRNPPIRLEAPRTLYDDTTKPLKLSVLYPSFLENVRVTSQSHLDPNTTCAVLQCDCGSRRILFPGDIGCDELRRLSHNGAQPMECDILAVPHHGGKLGDSCSPDDYDWVYKNAIKCRYGVISVGTSNIYGHPRAEHIQALRNSGATVLCTQITSRCCEAEEMELLRPGLVPIGLPGDSSSSPSLTGANRTRRLSCAGSILVEIGPDDLAIKGLHEHGAAVDRLQRAPHGCPMCRR